MRLGKPSRTALAAAFHRAAHQVLEGGRIYCDPLALRILGEDAEAVARQAAEQPSRRRMRAFIAARTRFAEDALVAAIERAVSQVVILGAGLDTYAYRSSFKNGMHPLTAGARLRTFEVDHPATQEWKRQRLRDVDIPLPDALTFAPVDFEHETLADGLRAAGFDCEQQTFFTWLGVVPYLKEEAVWVTLAFIASLPHGAHVVFDYSDPPATLPPEARARHDRRAARVAALDEPWVTYFEAAMLRARLTALGFTEIEDLGPAQIASRYFPSYAKSLPNKGGHILRATTL